MRRIKIYDPAVPSIRISKNRGRYELKFALNGRIVYVGAYARRENALASGTGMLERGEADTLFERKR